MGEQIYFEDINVGDELPTVPRHAVHLYDIVRWCKAVDDHTGIHVDEAHAKSAGFPNAVVPGPQLGAYMMTAIISWAGEWGNLKAMKHLTVAMTFPDSAANFTGKVTNKYTKAGENYVELDIRLENQRGEISNRATALVTLPSKPSK